MFCEICQVQTVKDCRILLIYKILKVTEVGNRMGVASGYGRRAVVCRQVHCISQRSAMLYYTD